MADALFDQQTELGRDLAHVDWAATALGPVSEWPASLRNVVRLLLGSRFAMWMAWGPELTFVCNDAYRRDTLGAKYPWALGQPAPAVWSEIWPDIGPRIESVIRTGVATWDESLLLFLERSGYQEETYHTFSYSPIADDNGTIAGILCVVIEETARVVGERRMGTLRDLGAGLAAATTAAEVGDAAARLLATSGYNLPFTLGYLFNEDRTVAELAWSAGVPDRSPVALARLPLAPNGSPWPVLDLAEGRTRLIEDLRDRFTDLPTGAWSEPPRRALLVPFTDPGRGRPFGFMVAGLNPYRTPDADYRGFVELVAGQIAAAMTRGVAFEDERRRAEELAALDQAKTTFFTNISHELRTPLTLLLGPATDALQDRQEPLPTAQRDRIEVIQRNGERLLKLVNTLLDFSRMESDQVRARFEPIDLAAYTAELSAMFESALRRAGLHLTVESKPLEQRVYVDREMWAKIVLNLLSNALKATFTGGVTVRLGERDGAVELSVTDTGIGIAPAEQQRLFERFHQVSGAALRSHEGSGIGLALVAELADLHGGTVAVHSAPGAGSTFIVRVPAGRDHLPADQISDVVTETDLPASAFGAGYLAEADRWLRTDKDARTEMGPGDPAGRPRVLVVDDNADMRDYIVGLLDREYSVDRAVDGVDALERIQARPPDLVLTDVMMPRLDGFGLLARLRDDPGTMHLPVIMLSARSGDQATVEGLEAGADDYLVKPFSARELTARVRANLELDRVRRVAGELANSRALLDQAEELAHVGSWQIDLRDGQVTASSEFYRITALSRAEVAAGGLSTALRAVLGADRAAIDAALARTAQDGTPLDLELHLERPDGEVRLVRVHGRLDRDTEGQPRRLRGSVQDITEQRAAELAVAATAAAREAAAREHAIAEELQRSLLPASALRSDGLHIATYYQSGVEGTQAGGDWYDIIELGESRTALVIGDVMGRGVRAAAVMGQLRATARAYARLDLPVGELLGLLDEVVRHVGGPTIVTCVYAIHDRRRNTLTYGNAGHVPPLLSEPGQPTRRLVVGDPPLGTGCYRGRIETVPWLPGTVLTLYTDGLVEHRGSDIDVGIDRLAELAQKADVPIEGLPDRLIAELLPHEPDDDVAVLIATPRGDDSPAPLVRRVPAIRSAVGEARAVLDQTLADWQIPDETVFTTELMVSELLNNAVLHGKPPIELHLRLDGNRLVAEISDAERRMPQARALDPARDNGRGLHLVAALSDSWGSRPSGAGKSVWFTLRVTAAEAATTG